MGKVEFKGVYKGTFNYGGSWGRPLIVGLMCVVSVLGAVAYSPPLVLCLGVFSGAYFVPVNLNHFWWLLN